MGAFKESTECLLVFVVVFSTQHILTVSAVYTIGETCRYVGNGFIANPDTCQGFGYCENGELLGTSLCPTGYLFNSKLSVCDQPENVDCSVVDPASSCKFANDKSFVADPTNCNRYCYCENKLAKCLSCPKFQVYNTKVNRCEWPDRKASATCSADSVCRLARNGVNVGDPKKCGQYLTCYNGLSIDSTPNGGKCPTPNTYYNPKIGQCQYENPCEDTTQDGVDAPIASDSKKCKSSNATAGSPKFIADGQTCMGYFICTSNEGPGKWSKCPLGLHFNGIECVTPYTFACQHDRCGNINQEFVGAIGNKCQNYLYCKKQTSQSLVGDYKGKTCGNNLYFDEFVQQCVPQDPSKNSNYKLCASSPNPPSKN